jgi:hypothetical protein
MKRIAAEGYHHTVDAWTVGRLREALAGLPDDALVTAVIPHSLGPRPTNPGDIDDHDWVLTEVEEGVGLDPAVLILDRPTGRYVHIHREEEVS